jgi:hypothetical protein
MELTMTLNELRRHTVLCERLALGAIPYKVAQELARLAEEFEAEAMARVLSERHGRPSPRHGGRAAA